jgi:tRNA threonylcarbamoyl adenosine modification protein YeaZ
MTKPNAKPCILALETSGALLSVSVWHEGKIASLISHDIKHGHAKDIVPTAMVALQQAGCGFEMVTHVAAGVGPGSFTGIRVALACAKGFCLAWGAQGIGVSGLQALASNAAQQGHNDGAPMLITADTRRGSLYGQFFDADGQASGEIFDAAASELPARRVAMRQKMEDGRDKAHVDMPLFIGGYNGGSDDRTLVEIFAADGVRVIQPPEVTPLDAAMIAADANRQIISGQTISGQAMTGQAMKGTIRPLSPLYLAAAKLGPKKGEVKKGAGKKGTGKKGTGKKRTDKQDKNRAGGTG